MELTKNNYNFGYRNNTSCYNTGRLRKHVAQIKSRKYRPCTKLDGRIYEGGIAVKPKEFARQDSSSIFLNCFKLFNFSMLFTFSMSLRGKKMFWPTISEMEKFHYWDYSNTAYFNGKNNMDRGYDWETLEESIKKDGFITPIVLREESKFPGVNNKTIHIVDGNHRFHVAKKLFPPDKKIPCIWGY